MLVRQTDTTGNVSVSARLSYEVETTAPAAATDSVIAGDDLDGGGYGEGDTITLQFSEAIDTSLLTLEILDGALDNSHSFGRGATIAPNTG